MAKEKNVTRKALADCEANPLGLRVFGKDGAVAEAMGPSFRENPMQVEYADLVLATVARGMAPATRGRVTVVEAATGSGKTQPLLVGALLGAVLSPDRGRSLYSTYTRQLVRQIMRKEAAVAIETVRRLTGIVTTVAPYRSRSAFVSPTRAADYVAELAAADKPDEADAVAAFARHDARARERLAAGEADDVVAEVDGLLESFADEDPDKATILAKLPYDRWCLTGDCPADEKVLWELYRQRARTATLVLVTHAAMLQEVRFCGTLLSSNERPYAMVVVDEAHLLEKAAASALSDTRSIHDLSLDCGRLQDAVAKGDGDLSDRAIALSLAARDVGVAASALLAATRKEIEGIAFGNGRVEVTGREPWLPDVVRVEAALRRVLAAAGKDRDQREEVGMEGPRYEQILAKQRSLANFLRVRDWRLANPGKTGLLRPYLRYTPIRREPVLEVVPVAGQRILNRLWEETRNGEVPALADAVFFTSATLGDPTKSGDEALRSRRWSLGIDRRQLNVNMDLCGTLEPKAFGFPTFFLAHQAAPSPSPGGAPEDRKVLPITPASAAYAAHAISLASGHGRVMVPTGSFRDAAAIAAALARIRPDLSERVIVRDGPTPVFHALNRFEDVDGAILVSPGIDTGTDLRKPVDCLVVARLPFPPPDPERDGDYVYHRAHAEMIQRLRQILGRAIRSRDACPRIYVTDPRFGMTARMANRLRTFLPRAQTSGVSAVPVRHQKFLDEAEIIPLPADEAVAA